ncbi:DUF4123 domain-containing protein [uncultured Tateyamaria sp.]|uniref:DUF4123 domain-containing protein n=1 Tax=Tateyamaria sp. 1078 TaxID=3417464 RepID=UPI002621C081|nr:DUF4123 domain-containing protein [uncultured Tateyamaria sp.]
MLPPTLQHLILDDARTQEQCAALAVWAERVQQVGLRLYLALDAVWAEDLATYIRAKCDQWEPLEGEPLIPRDDAHPRAPILVDITAHPDIIQPWVEQHFLARIGVIFASKLKIGALRTSLKRFGLVAPEGAEGTVVFRYFDAEVLDAFMRVSHGYQRKDFFEGIDGVILPDIDGETWQFYRLRDKALVAGTYHADAIDWVEVPATTKGPSDGLAYEVSFPFRTLTAPQMEAMERACRVAFHREATRFITLAFPDECTKIPPQDIMELAAAAHDIAEENGAGEESAAFLWIILSFMSGLDFNDSGPVKELLGMRGKDRESTLEDLVFDIGVQLENIHLIDLCDTIEVWAETEDGARTGTLHRSGRPLGGGSQETALAPT